MKMWQGQLHQQSAAATITMDDNNDDKQNAAGQSAKRTHNREGRWLIYGLMAVRSVCVWLQSTSPRPPTFDEKTGLWFASHLGTHRTHGMRKSSPLAQLF